MQYKKGDRVEYTTAQGEKIQGVYLQPTACRGMHGIALELPANASIQAPRYRAVRADSIRLIECAA